MNDPQHLSSFVPGALNELLAMIEKGKREREKKGVDLQLQFPFTLNMNEHKGENEAHNKKENYERTKRNS